MPKFGPNNVFLGSTQINRAYLGGALLFDVTAPDPVTGVQASGGVETVINPEPGEFYRVHTFLESGDLTVTQGGEVDALVVAGGGSGGHGDSGNSGGGGAGGLIFRPNLQINSGLHPAVVGDGGPTSTLSLSSAITGNGTNGENSSVFDLVALGGGKGNQVRQGDGFDGGSGGGGGERFAAAGAGIQSTQPGDSGAFGFGNDGGIEPNNFVNVGLPGGGGAGQPGEDGNSTQGAGDGGDGLSEVTIAGVTYVFAEMFGTVTGEQIGNDVFFAGGGGGSTHSSMDVGLQGAGGKGGGGEGGGIDFTTSGVNGQAGLPNTGGGGGGGARIAQTITGEGGAGGSGIVIIRYPITEAEYNAEAA